MELEITNFRSFEYKKFEIFNGFYLLSGISGSGKSTFLESLEWVLYGGKVVAPFHVKSKKELTKVILNINNLEITRTKPPDKLSVRKGETLLESDEAQNYINQIFGSKLFWKTTTYLSQDCRHNLLFGSKDEKNEIIKELIYGIDVSNQNPDYYLEKVTDYSKNLDSKIDFYLGKIDYLSESLKDKEKPKMEQKEYTFYTKLMNKKKEELEEKRESTRRDLILVREKDQLVADRKNVLQKLADYPDIDLKKINKWKNYIKYSKELKDLPEFQKNDIPSEEFKKQIIIMEENYKLFKINSEKCIKLEIEYSEEVIEKKINTFEKRIEQIEKYQRYLKVKNNIDRVTDQIRSAKEKINKLENFKQDNKEKIDRIANVLKIDHSLNSIQEKLNELKTEFLICPSCDKKVRLSGGKLVEENGECLEKSKVEKIKTEVTRMTEVDKLLLKEQDKLKMLNSLYSEMEIPEKVDEITGNVDSYKQVIEKLKSIKFIEFDKQQYLKLQSNFKNSELTEKENFLKSEVDNNYQDEFEGIKPPEDFSAYFNDYQSLKQNLRILEERLENLQNLEEQKIVKNIQKLDDIFDNFDKVIEIQKIGEEEQKLESIKVELNQFIKKKETSVKIKKIIEDVSSKTFENLIIHFNKLLNQILQEIFENIQIEIGMFKKMKGKNTVKPQFNMKVLLKGNEYDNLNFLSGGEKDRISIALLVTLSVITNNKFLMLDESMSSLDEEMRNQTLNLIKKYLPDKTVFNVCHFTVEGFYDHIINF